MNKINLLPTDKPCRLCIREFDNKLCLHTANRTYHGINQHIYITSEEEIRDCWVLNNYTNEVYFLKGYYGIQPISKKIILTTDQSLDGVQAIDDEFLEWFVKNPSCENVEVVLDEDIDFDNNKWIDSYHIIIPKEEAKREFVNKTSKWNIEDFEEPKQKCKDCNISLEDCTCIEDTIDMKQENSNVNALDFEIKALKSLIQDMDATLKSKYSEEEVIELLYKRDLYMLNRDESLELELTEEWFEQFKKK